MKKHYEPPKAEIEMFTVACVISTSATNPGPGEGVGDGGDTEF